MSHRVVLTHNVFCCVSRFENENVRNIGLGGLSACLMRSNPGNDVVHVEYVDPLGYLVGCQLQCNHCWNLFGGIEQIAEMIRISKIHIILSP